MKSRDRLYEIIGVIKKYDLIKNITPVKLRNAIEELGPTFVKLGQIMASRDDIIPKEYSDELSHLRNQVTPMNFDELSEILESEYGGKTDDVFKVIKKRPIGSASIAQVHRANLKDGTEVVLKVQRSGIYEKMEMDVKLLKKVYSYLHLDHFFNTVLDFEDVIDEMFDTAKEEMDFLIEAENTVRFYENNKDIKYIRAPRVYKEYTTSKVLVMEYMDGLNIDDIKTLEDEGYDMEEIGEKLAANYIKQAIDDGFFHADPHNENLRIKDGKIVYLDFGMMGKLSKHERELFSRCIVAILKGDTTEISHILLTLGTSSDINHMRLKNDINMVLRKNMTRNASDINMKEFLNDLLFMLSSNDINLPRDITMLIRGIIVIEGVLKDISPNINLVTILSSHVSPKKMFDKEKAFNYVQKGIESGTDLVLIPNEVLTFLKGVNSGELQFNIELNDSKHQMRNLEQLVHLVIITILDVAYIIGTSLIAANYKGKFPFIFYIYLILGGLCTFWLLYKLFESRIRNRRR